MNNIQELIGKHDGSRYQEQLGVLIVKNNLKTIVETGYGVTTLHILKALDEIGEGRLISIDPSAWFNEEIIHPRLTVVKQKSVDCLVDIYYQYGPFDLFNHDSDHEIFCQTYEYWTSFQFLKPGGFLSSDDHFWNSHGAWQKFCKQNSLTASPLGGAEYIQKPFSKPYCPASEAKYRHETYFFMASKAEEEWLAAGGIKHPAFQ